MLTVAALGWDSWCCLLTEAKPWKSQSVSGKHGWKFGTPETAHIY